MYDPSTSWNRRPLEHWIPLLQAPEDEARWGAVDAMRHIAPPAMSVKILIGALGDRYWKVRALATHALHDLIVDGDIQIEEHDLVKVLSDLLDDESIEVSVNAAYALESIGPKAFLAIPALRRAIHHKEDRLRIASLDALANIES